MQKKVPSVRLIFSRRVKDLLLERGFQPLRRIEDVKKPGFWVWEFEVTPAFHQAFIEIAGKKGGFNG